MWGKRQRERVSDIDFGLLSRLTAKAKDSWLRTPAENCSASPCQVSWILGRVCACDRIQTSESKTLHFIVYQKRKQIPAVYLLIEMLYKTCLSSDIYNLILREIEISFHIYYFCYLMHCLYTGNKVKNVFYLNSSWSVTQAFGRCWYMWLPVILIVLWSDSL